MWNAFKAISWRVWLTAFLTWFLATFAFLGALQDAWGGVEAPRVMDVLALQASLAFKVFEVAVIVPFRFSQIFFAALLCPILVVPVLAVLMSVAGRTLKRQPHVRVWLQATVCWFLLAGVVSAAYALADAEGKSRFFTGLFFLVFGPFYQVLRFISGPNGAVSVWPWSLSVLVCPLIWVPAAHYVLRIWHRSRAAAGKERPLPELHPELEDESSEGL